MKERLVIIVDFLIQLRSTNSITMGLKTIMDSKEIYLIAQGKSKWDIIREAFYGEITEKVPASILQRHENLTVLYCD